ncbi:MAG TPA: fatty acid--CoA ligase family protein [Tepidisphaeraceae bacterium]|nr:fatty acid--CoA ligase family protein [Tepidisphaeraceae bacterium]
MMSLQLLQKLRLHAKRQGDRPAIRQVIPADGRTPLTWSHLLNQVDTLSSALHKRLPAGGILMLCSQNRADYTTVFLAALAANLTVFPIAPDIAPPELLSAAGRAGAAAILSIAQPTISTSGAFAGSAAFPEAGPDALLHTRPRWPLSAAHGPALLLLSSGTTGQPRIVRRDGPSLDAVSANMAQAVGFTARDQVLAAVPLCHSYGLEHGLLAPVWAGSTMQLFDRFDLNAALAVLSDDQGSGATIFPGVPFMFEMLCAERERGISLPDLRRAYSAGGPLPRTLYELMERKFGVRVSQLYGATEIGSVTYNDPDVAPFDPASVGRPMAGVSIRILDPANPQIAHPLHTGADGHVAVAAPSMLSGYVDGDPPPLLDGHFLTGDLGRLDPSGSLTITGRIKLLIDIGGRKVNPLEVEQAIAGHPAVGECVVVPIRIGQTLNRLRAVLAPARAGETVDVRELRAYLRGRLSAYKIPRVFEVRATLPRSPAGKILRAEVEREQK